MSISYPVMVFSLENNFYPSLNGLIGSVLLEDRELALHDFGNKTRSLVRSQFSMLGDDFVQPIARVATCCLEAFQSETPAGHYYSFESDDYCWLFQVGVVKSDMEYIKWLNKIGCPPVEAPVAVSSRDWRGALQRAWRRLRSSTSISHSL